MNPRTSSGAALTISTLGPLAITWKGQAIKLGNGKPAALLAYLASEPGQHLRETLADLFWPEQAVESARLNLRQTIFQLRNSLQKATGHDFIVASRQHIGLAQNDTLHLLGSNFGAPLPLCMQADANKCSTCLGQLSELADSYRGPFLAEFCLPDSPGFEEWLIYKRDALHRRALDLLTRLADCHEKQGKQRAALSFAQRYTELEPWSEAGHLRTMRLYVQNGQPEAALAQYETCRRVLESELGVRPNAELQHFAKSIRTRIESAPPEVDSIPSEERRQVTVLYCEISASGIDDPEDAIAILREPQARCRAIVRQHAGHVVQTYNGSLLAYFGYPQALENAALYAVRAAGALVAQSSPQLAVRIGIHSGLIVTSVNPAAPDAIGTTSGIAIRLRELADAGEIVVSAESRHRVTGYFHFARIGKHLLRKLSHTVEAFRVIGQTGACHRLAANSRLAPLTGRDPELARLFRTWAEARQGAFLALLLSGEAGIGKSRLVTTLIQRLDNGSGIVRELRCFPESRNSPLHPVITLLGEQSGWNAEDDATTRCDKLKSLLETHSPGLAKYGLPLLSRFTGLLPEMPLPPKACTPEELNGATCDLLSELLYSLSSRYPVLMVAEDLHWADDLTLDLLRRLVARQRPGPILLLVTARPEFRPDWPQLETMTLNPLPDADIARLIDALPCAMDDAKRQRIIELAEGIPLFAEELAAVADRSDCELPVTLHDLLMTRIDALGPARPLAQRAATLGREFDIDLLAASCELPSREFANAIRRLQDSGLVYETQGPCLQFRHALIQEVAYNSQTKAARKITHRRIAEALGTLRPDDCHDRPELLARHWSLAGEAARAVPLWLAAGRQAAERFAHHAAVAHYEAALCNLGDITPGSDRDRLEFTLLVGLAQSEQVVAGYGNSRSAELLERAITLLGSEVGQGEDLFRIVWGLWEGAGSRIGHREAVRLAERLIDIARAEHSPELLLQGEYALGNSLFWNGRLPAARHHLETALNMLPPATAQPLRDCYGSIVEVGIKVYLAWTLWLQGETESAEAYVNQAVVLARNYGDAYGTAFALTFAATLKRWQGNIPACRKLAEEGRQAAADSESAVFSAAMSMSLGWASVMAGEVSALPLIEQGIAAIRTAMRGVVVPLLAPYAEVLLHLNEANRALPILDEALAQAEATQDFHYLPELLRMKGLCLLACGRRKAALPCFKKARQAAVAQGASVFVQRAEAELIRH